MVVGALTHCALLHSVHNLKAAQLNVQCSLIQELMLYGFKLSYCTTEAPKNICCAKGGGDVDHSSVTWWFKKFHSDCKNLNNQARSKTVNFEAMIKAIEVNPGSSNQSVSGEFSILLSCVVYYLHDLSKSCQIMHRYQNCAKLLTHSCFVLFCFFRFFFFSWGVFCFCFCFFRFCIISYSKSVLKRKKWPWKIFAISYISSCSLPYLAYDFSSFKPFY